MNPDPTDAARFLARYAKEYHAGAFATPLANELLAAPESVIDVREGRHRTVAVVRRPTARSRRRDFTGAPIELAAGATVVTHLARTPGAPLPRLGADYVMAYAEDFDLARRIEASGLAPIATRITAASEIITVWGPPGEARRYSPADLATIATPPLAIPVHARNAVLREVAAVHTWHDDFPYYSDGSWSAVSLRGFRPDDPRWGIKPAEMPRRWRDAHPEAAHYRCGWTTLAGRCSTLKTWVASVPWWGGLERVRLLRMAGRPGRTGRLGRHTDITDRAMGTRDGAVARFHIPLVTHPDVRMHVWNLDGTEAEAHLPAWQCVYLDARKPHAVTNPSGTDRIHLVVDVVADETVRGAIAAAAIGAAA